VLVLVPHEPTLDPRVHYTSESLATRHAVTMTAIVQPREERPAENRPVRASYTTTRIPFRPGGGMGMLMAFLGIWLTPRSRHGALTTLRRSAGLVVLALPGAAALAAAALVRMAAHTAGPGLRRLGVPTAPVGRLVRGPRLAVAVLRFAAHANRLLWRAATAPGSPPPAVVYCHDLFTLQTGVLIKRRFGARLVYDSHEYYPYQYPYRSCTTVLRAYESVLVKDVDVYITVSPQLAAELQRVYDVATVHAIPNVEPVPAPRPPVLASPIASLAEGRLRLLFQGTFAEGRGLEEVLHAWTAVDGARAALFLRGPDGEWRGRLERLAGTLGVLGRSVYFVPPVLEKDLIGAAQEAHVGLIPYTGDWPSYRFACPNKLSQYLHAGLAVLANRIPFVEDLVTRGEVGLCYDVREPGSFARAVDLLARDRSWVEELGRNARRFSDDEYNWARYEDKLLALVDGSVRR
jgi:glycosyltransferase involved in cell wall biosynthesis